MLNWFHLMPLLAVAEGRRLAHHQETFFIIAL